MSADVEVSSISNYVDCVTSVSGPWCDEKSITAPWFRGIGDAKQFKLVPRLYREPGIDHLKEEAKIRVAFSSRASQCVTSNQKREPWDWYFLMQHYGVPTRLLDWTESALVALYFALYAWKPASHAFPAVWVLNPFALNRATVGLDSILVPGDDTFTTYLPKCGSTPLPPLPVAIHPEYTDPRMKAQCSKFTMHGSVTLPLEGMVELEQLRAKKQLLRIVIKAEDPDAIESFKDSLALLGMRSSTVFPDLEGLAKDIRRDYTPNQE